MADAPSGESYGGTTHARNPPPPRGVVMRRTGPILRRRPIRPKATPRDWRPARAKVESEGRCRLHALGGCAGALQAAHTIGRKHDRREGGVLIVDPALVVTLCRHHHERYDAHEIDLRPHLTPEELAAALAASPTAERRLAGRVWRDEASAPGEDGTP